jgi:butyrate kinase
MRREIEEVELSVLNAPGVLDRVVGHIRHEGWNIKRLFVDETEQPRISHMEISIEGTHTKLAQVMEHLLNLDCVLSASMTLGGRKVVRRREIKAPADEMETPIPAAAVPDKPAGVFRILTINPGSTSTKFAVYDDETPILVHTVRHDRDALAQCGSILDQKDLRKDCVTRALREAGVGPHTVDAVAGRGGLLKPIESGVYRIGAAMLQDLQYAAAAVHASALGAVIASEIAGTLGRPAYVVDPIVVDEMDRHAKLTGMPGIERASIFHALNQKAIARRLADQLGKPYENCRFVVAHLGGGITVGAHRYGRVIDVNDAISGEGPFTPERAGHIPAVPLIRLCYSGEYTEAEMVDKVIKNSGMRAYLGTNDLRKVQKMINDGDEFAALVMDSMAYQVSKEIGAMAMALEAVVDAIILTGGLAHSNRFTGAIKQRVDKLAPVYVFPGEDETLALSSGVLRVLRGQEAAADYEARQFFLD